MSETVVLMPSTGDQTNIKGEAAQADGWFGFADGLHTVSFHVRDFTGRIKIQATLALEPTEDDWFDIWLTQDSAYLQYPINHEYPTGNYGGDTGVKALNFKANVLWIRAVLDRRYLTSNESTLVHGSVQKIILSR